MITKTKKTPYLFKCPKNDDELHEYVKRVYGIEIPRVAVCEGHVSPFEFMADLFFERTKDALGIAARGTGKTKVLGALHSANSVFKKNCETATAGAVQSQASRCYNYFKNMIEPYRLKGIVNQCLMSKTIFAKPWNSTIEVLTGTVNQMNSPHPNIAALDEFELTKWEVFQEFLQMSLSKDGLEAQNILTSTRKYAFGTVQRLMNQLQESGFRLYMWCVWESIEQCERASCDDCKEIIKGQYPDGSPRTFYSVCQGKAKRSRGFRKLNDIIKVFRNSDARVWDAQQECKKPSSEGSVFYWFDFPKHVRNFDVDFKDRNIKIYLSTDWGGRDPNVCQFWAEIGERFYLFDEIYIRNIAPSTFAEKIHEKINEYNIPKVTEIFCDPSSVISRYELEKAGLMTTPAINDINEGIDLINSLGNDNRIILHERCAYAIREFGEYHWNPNTTSKIPVDKDNHSCDAARYFFMMRNPIMGNSTSLDFYKDKYIETERKQRPDENKTAVNSLIKICSPNELTKIFNEIYNNSEW